MDVVVEEKSPVSKLVSVTLEESSLSGDIAKRLGKLAKKVKLHGFRPGKAPKKLLEKKYGPSVRMDAIDDAVRRSLTEALDREELQGTIHVSRPELKSGMVEGEAVSFAFIAERLPELEATGYEGVEVQMLDVKVSEEDVTSELERLQDQAAAVVPIEDRTTVEATDIVVVSYKGVGEGEVGEIHADEQQIDLADPALLPGFADGIAGAELNTATDVTVDLPAEFGIESLAGQTITLNVTVTALKRTDKPELNDAFAAEVSDFETLDALKADIEAKLLANRTKGAETTAKRSLISKVVEANPAELPELYVSQRAAEEAQQRLRHLASQGFDLAQLGSDITAFAESMKGDVKTAIHESVVMRAIGKEHAIEVTDEDIETHLAKQAEESGQPLARLKAQLANPEARDQLRSRMTYDRVVDLIWSKAKVEKVDALPEEETNPEHGAEGHVHGEDCDHD